MSETSEVAKQETVRQAIILVFSVAGALVTIWVMEELAKPDMMRTLKMASALWAKRFCQEQADRFQGLADKAATAYNREKN